MSFVCRHLIGVLGGVIGLSYGMFRHNSARIHVPSGARTHNPRVKDMSRPGPRGDSGVPAYAVLRMKTVLCPAVCLKMLFLV